MSEGEKFPPKILINSLSCRRTAKAMAENITKADLHFQVSTCNHFDEKLHDNANFEISSPFNSDLTNIFQNIVKLLK